MFKVEANLKEIATRQLTQRRARKEGEARRPVTTVNCKALHGLQFRATVEGHSFISDEGDEAGGHDAGPAPLRYFLAGIMMCHQVWCVKSSAVADVQLDRLQGEISGLSRSVSNLGSSIGTAIAGTILVAGLADANRSYGIAMIVLAVIGLLGLGATVLLPKGEPQPATDAPAPKAEQPT